MAESFISAFLVGGKTSILVFVNGIMYQSTFLTSDVTLLYVSDTLLMYSPLLLQSGI